MKVSMISEGGYPVARGGLGEWAHSLISNMEQVDFDVFALVAEGDKPVWEQLPNVTSTTIVPLSGAPYPRYEKPDKQQSTRLAGFLEDTLGGNCLDFGPLLLRAGRHPISKKWLYSRRYWDYVCSSYEKTSREVPFTEYYWTNLGLNVVIIDSLNAFFRIPRADVYHALSAGFAGFLGAMAKEAYGTPLLLSEQGFYLREREQELQRANVSAWYRRQLMTFSESLVKTSYKYADFVVPPTESHKTVEVQLGLDGSKIRVIKNGIDCDHFVPGKPRCGLTPVVGCFARVVPVKDIETLIMAAERVCQNHNVDFIVAGEAQDLEYKIACEQLVNELGLNKRFKFLGHIDSLKGMQNVDIFALSSYSEGMPYALLEAMSCGLPAVCTAVGGIPDIVRDDTGFTVPAHDSAAFAEKICVLLDDKRLRHDQGCRAREIALSEYTIAKMCREFFSLYQELFHGRH